MLRFQSLAAVLKYGKCSHRKLQISETSNEPVCEFLNAIATNHTYDNNGFAYSCAVVPFAVASSCTDDGISASTDDLITFALVDTVFVETRTSWPIRKKASEKV